MKNRANILCITLLLLIGVFEAVGAPPPPKKPRTGNSGTSCMIGSSKFASGDLIEYRFGVVAGVNSANFYTKDTYITDVIFRLTGGIAAQIIWPNGFVIQPAIMYSQKGCMLAGSSITYNADFVEVPVSFKYRLQIADIKPFAFIAPYGAYTLGMSVDGDMGESEEFFHDELNSFDYGIKAGAGFDVNRMQISFRYSFGLGQVINETFPVRNRVFTVTAGLFF